MKKLYSISFFLLFAVLVQAQTDLKKVVPPNPNVASLFKSVITPVTEYSGLPNVAVPLYTASEGGISIPISISYATGGIQVSEESGVVGLGWALNAGGAITRSINGEDDFKPIFGYLSTTVQHPSLPPSDDPINGIWNPDTNAFVSPINPPNSQEEICEFPSGPNGATSTYSLPSKPGASADQHDLMPDVFHFTFNGNSGSFVFDSNGNVFLLNKKGLKITHDFELGLPYFTIISEDGTSYEFKERSTTVIPNGPKPQSYISAWYLSKIRDIYGNSAILNYDTSELAQPLPSFTQNYKATVAGSEQLSYSYENIRGPNVTSNNVFLTSIELKKANNKTQEVQLTYSDDRLDMNSKYLESIEVLDSNLEPVNRYDFQYCYFGSNKQFNLRDLNFSSGDYGAEINALESGLPHLNLRLKLESVTENNISTHSFEYYTPGLIPNKTSTAQDYWGFYNGQLNPNTFIPYAYSHAAQFSTFTQEKKAKRYPSEDFSKIFSLKTITYPTGGSTAFDYELNTYDDIGNFNDAPLSTVPVSKRASQVSTPDPNDSETSVTIKPNQYGVLKLTYNITVTGWNTNISAQKPNPPDFLEDFYVEIRDNNGNLLRPRVTIPTNENSGWDDLTVEQNNNYGAVISHTLTENWIYDLNGDQLTEDEYVIIAHFNSHNGLYYGQADIHAEWEDVEVGLDKAYSIGGGLRVASITDFDNDGNLETQKSYNYHYNEELADGTVVEKSRGKIKTLPNFAIHQAEVLNLSVWESDNLPFGALPTIIASATSHNSFSKDFGSYVGYDQVEITSNGSDGDNGKTIKYFINQPDHFRSVVSVEEYRDSYYKYPPVRVPHNGLLKKEEHYKREGETYTLLGSSTNEYTINDIEDGQFNLYTLYQNDDRVISASKELIITNLAAGGTYYWFCDAMEFQLYPYYSNLIQQTGTTQTIYDTEGNNPVTTTQEFKYENPIHLQRTESKLTNSKGEEVITRTFYPDDIADNSTLEGPDLSSTQMNLINRFKKNDINSLHRIAEPIQTVTTVNGIKTMQRTSYQDWALSPNVNSYKVWPASVKTLKGDFHETDNPLENRLNYHEYDGVGNPLEVSKENGTRIAYLWGYDLKYPIAKIERATFDIALSAALSNLPNGFSDLDTFIKSLDDIQNDSSQKDQWEDFNEDFRSALSDQMITTFTYDPLVGVTSVTDPRGYTIYYLYDVYNRLKEVRDAAGDLVTDYEYHYKGQTN